MTRLLWVLLLLAAAAGVVALAWQWLPVHPGAGYAAPARTFLPARESGPEDFLSLAGTIEAEGVAVASEVGGTIVRLEAKEGDRVGAGQPLVELDTSLLQAQMAQALAAVAVARADLEQVKAGSYPGVILAARATLRQAEAERDAAVRAWQDAQAFLASPQAIDAQIAEAQAALDLAQAQVEGAQSRVAAAQAERDQYRAQGSLEQKGLYIVYGYQVQAAEAALKAAQAGQAAAQQNLAALKALRSRPLALLSQVHLAESQVAVAEAAVAVAEAKVKELEAGPTGEEVRLAEAQLARAEAGVDALRLQIDRRTLRSPVDGVVLSLPHQVGETAVAGTVLFKVAALDPVQLWVYVPLASLGRVSLGQEVVVRVDAFPGRVFAGRVSYVAQQAEFTPGNVQTEEDRLGMVFLVRVRLPNPDHSLRPGMSAEADFR